MIKLLPMKQASKEREVWIGVVEIAPGPNCILLELDEAAFTSVLTFAADSAEFEQRATDMLQSYGVVVLGFEGVEPFRLRKIGLDPSAELVQIAEELEPTRTRFATIHKYPFRKQ